MMVIGIGSTSAATSADVGAAVRAIEDRTGASCGLIATLKRGAPDAAIAAACTALDRPLRLYDAADLISRLADCQTHSPASFTAHAIPSVAEAAALAGAGPGSRLTISRIAFERVTAAAAISAPAEEPTS